MSWKRVIFGEKMSLIYMDHMTSYFTGMTREDKNSFSLPKRQGIGCSKTIWKEL